jgi:hypothetical protein
VNVKFLDRLRVPAANTPQLMAVITTLVIAIMTAMIVEIGRHHAT